MNNHEGQFCRRTRREFLWETGAGFTGLALTGLLSADGFFERRAAAAEPGTYANPLAPRRPNGRGAHLLTRRPPQPGADRRAEVALPAVRPVGQVGQRPVSAPGDL